MDIGMQPYLQLYVLQVAIVKLKFFLMLILTV